MTKDTPEEIKKFLAATVKMQRNIVECRDPVDAERFASASEASGPSMLDK